MKRIQLKKIHRYLIENNIKNTKIGYLYLAAAIEIGLENLENIYYVMKLYEEIAQRYNASTGSVERAIRTAILPTGRTSKEFISFAVYNIMYGTDQESSKPILGI